MATALVAIAGREARSQVPTRLPEVVIKADPGPKAMAGFVRDTMGAPIEGVDITIPTLQRRTLSRPNGSWRFDDLPKGKREVRARKIGYAPQIITIKVGDQGGTGDFELVPAPRTLPAVVSSASRLGLSGVVADTAFQSLPAATVRALGASGMHTETDSLGRFYLPVRPGNYMVAVTKPGFKDRVVGVSIPADSGRQLLVALMPGSAGDYPGESLIIPDLEDRMTRTTEIRNHLFTRERMQQMGIEWMSEVVTAGWVQNGQRGLPSTDCYAVVNGGPKIQQIKNLTIEEIESVEVYTGGYVKATPVAPGPRGTVMVGKRGIADSRPTIDLSHPSMLRDLYISNRGMNCPVTYVWTR